MIRLSSALPVAAVVVSGVLASASSSDGRSEILKLPPVRVAMNHASLLANRPKPRIAFLLATENKTSRALVDQAIAILTRKDFSVMDRENIERIIREQRFQGSELIDLDHQVQLGKIMGVTDLVIVSADAGLKVSFKALDITSARINRLVKDTFPDQKNAAKALAGFFVDWNETYELKPGPCAPLESGDYGSLSDTYALVLEAWKKPGKVEVLARAAGSRSSSGSRHTYSADGSTLYQLKTWSGEPEDSPKRSAYLVYEAYLEQQAGLLYLRQDNLDAALSHLEQAGAKLDKAAWQVDDADDMIRSVEMAARVVRRLKAEREAGDE